MTHFSRSSVLQPNFRARIAAISSLRRPSRIMTHTDAGGRVRMRPISHALIALEIRYKPGSISFSPRAYSNAQALLINPSVCRRTATSPSPVCGITNCSASACLCGAPNIFWYHNLPAPANIRSTETIINCLENLRGRNIIRTAAIMRVSPQRKNRFPQPRDAFSQQILLNDIDIIDGIHSEMKKRLGIGEHDKGRDENIFLHALPQIMMQVHRFAKRLMEDVLVPKGSAVERELSPIEINPSPVAFYFHRTHAIGAGHDEINIASFSQFHAAIHAIRFRQRFQRLRHLCFPFQSPACLMQSPVLPFEKE